MAWSGLPVFAGEGPGGGRLNMSTPTTGDGTGCIAVVQALDLGLISVMNHDEELVTTLPRLSRFNIQK